MMRHILCYAISSRRTRYYSLLHLAQTYFFCHGWMKGPGWFVALLLGFIHIVAVPDNGLQTKSSSGIVLTINNCVFLICFPFLKNNELALCCGAFHRS